MPQTVQTTIQTSHDSDMIGPVQRYQQALAADELRPDQAQAAAMDRLQRLFDELQVRKEDQSNWWQRLLGGRRVAPIQGLYFWGGVGRGKTCLMDMFYQCLPGERKQRMHFHRFMNMVHQQLNELKGKKNPLQQIGRDLAEKTDIICFDEFFVSDIGDAMLLGGLLQAMFDEGVVLVTTSNLPPRRLYENGLQRKQFLPAIKLIETHCEVLNVDGGHDYRLDTLEQAGLYFSPLDDVAEQQLDDCFRRLAGAQRQISNVNLEILGRTLKARRYTEGMVWFDYRELCEGPRSAADYIEIARQFHTVLLSGLPVLDARRDDGARRFIAMVDEFYDHGVKLVMSAAAPIRAIYTGRELAFAFERTISRVTEMQSHEYLEREHRP